MYSHGTQVPNTESIHQRTPTKIFYKISHFTCTFGNNEWLHCVLNGNEGQCNQSTFSRLPCKTNAWEVLLCHLTYVTIYKPLHPNSVCLSHGRVGRRFKWEPKFPLFIGKETAPSSRWMGDGALVCGLLNDLLPIILKLWNTHFLFSRASWPSRHPSFTSKVCIKSLSP